MFEQAWTSGAGEADRHQAVIFGDVFVVGWIYGSVLSLTGGAFAAPAAASAAFASPGATGAAFVKPALTGETWVN